MRYFVFGLGLSLLGALLWVAGGIQLSLVDPGPCNESVYCTPVVEFLRAIGFLVMIAAPFLFWLVLPVAWWIQHHKPER